MSCNRIITALLILFSFLFIFPIQLLSQESSTTYFGPYYRTNQFVPILVYQQKDFRAVWVENKHSKDMLIFNANNIAEALLKIAPDGTKLEIINAAEERKLLGLPFRILPEETPLIVCAGAKYADNSIPESKYISIETNFLPNMSISYEMIEVLIIKDSYPHTLSAQQTNAIREWVISGGIIIFETMETLKKHNGLSAALLKQTNPKFFESLSNDLLLQELGNTALNIQKKSILSNVAYGYIGIKPYEEISIADKLRRYCDGQIEWRIRNRNNSLSEKNTLKTEISEEKTLLTQKTTIIYFLVLIIALFLKLKNHFVKVACAISALAIIPIVIFSPSDKLDAHYYQLVEKKTLIDYSLLKEEVYINQGGFSKINLKLDSVYPFFINNDAKITLVKNLQGKYTEQIIQPNVTNFTLKKISITKNTFFEKIKKDNATFFYHKFPLSNMYEATENNVEDINFKIETFNKNGLITKQENSAKKSLRDNFEKKIWYAASNKIFYSSNHPQSFIVLEGTAKAIPLEVNPDLNIQKSFFSYIVYP